MTRHPWLPKDDPANTERNNVKGKIGYWVPRPEEIEKECEKLRSRHFKLMLVSFPDVVDTSSMQDGDKKQIEEGQLCDCPYWGTEFSECEIER